MGGGAVIGDVDVGPAIVVEVGANDAEARAESRADSGGFGDVLEGAVTAIVEQTPGNGLVHFGRAIVALAGGGEALLVALDCEIEIVGDEKVEAAVAVVVDPGGTGAPAGVVDAGFGCDVGKGAVAIVVIEDVAAEVGDVKILKAVVVVIADGDSHAVADVADAGFFGDIDEMELAGFGEHVAEQAIAGLPAGWGREFGAPRILRGIKSGALDEVDVEGAIVVVIEERNARAHDFWHEEFADGAVEMMEMEADFGGDFAEERGLRGSCGCGERVPWRERASRNGSGEES